MHEDGIKAFDGFEDGNADAGTPEATTSDIIKVENLRREVHEMVEAMNTLRNSTKEDFNKINGRISEVSSTTKEKCRIVNNKIYEMAD